MSTANGRKAATSVRVLRGPPACIAVKTGSSLANRIERQEFGPFASTRPAEAIAPDETGVLNSTNGLGRNAQQLSFS
jgi:hypothetical protein